LIRYIFILNTRGGLLGAVEPSFFCRRFELQLTNQRVGEGRDRQNTVRYTLVRLPGKLLGYIAGRPTQLASAPFLTVPAAIGRYCAPCSFERRKEGDVTTTFKLLFGLALIIASQAASSQSAYYLAQDVTISQVAPVANDATAFSVTVASLPGSSGYCTPGGSGGSGITFYLSSMPNGDANALQRLYATVLLAFSTGLPVNIASYTSGSNCASAAFVQITSAT
jgi:hypothetical protein